MLADMLRALVFDFDGLMVDTETVIIEAWERIHAHDGFSADRAVLHALVGHTDIVQDVWTAYPPNHDKHSLGRRWRDLSRSLMDAAPVLPGVHELLDSARAAGLRLAVASNSNRPHVENHLRLRGLDTLFDAICTRDEVQHPKPAPDVYLEALRRLGVAPGETLAFEDSVPGHLAAHRAGLRVIVIPGPSTLHDEFPHAALRLPTLAGLTLETLNSRF